MALTMKQKEITKEKIGRVKISNEKWRRRVYQMKQQAAEKILIYGASNVTA